MLFNSFTYLIFLPCVLALYWIFPERLRKPVLVAASYMFYMNWNAGYGLLLFILTVVNYGLGLAIHRLDKHKRLLVRLAVIFNLGSLCYFKYTNFLLSSFAGSLAWVNTILGAPLKHTWQSPTLDILLPLGISFFTFEFIHYTVDVYRGSKPVTNFIEFALFGAFFPSQIAGPIKRFQDFVKQLHNKIVFSANNFREGCFFIFQGLFKKIVLGDNLGTLANYGFNNVATLGTLDAWIAVLAFTLQIYFDFSGYTDIGRGSALLFGFRVPENFNRPYLASSVTEFWHRWHMSLSTWLRDYLYIPLGGSSGTKWQVRRNLFLTMLLGSLWHGASWHFVVWGAIHGTALIVHKYWQEVVSKTPVLNRLRPHPIWHWAGIAVTFAIVVFAWIMFRANTVGDAFSMLAFMMPFQSFSPSLAVISPGVFSHSSVQAATSGALTNMLIQSTVPISLVVYSAYVLLKQGIELVVREPANAWHNAVYRMSRYWDDAISVRVIAYAAVAIIILSFAPGSIAPFIYFQF